MVTLNQLRRIGRHTKIRKRSYFLEDSPMRKGVVKAVTTVKPKKPNSARRPIVIVQRSNKVKAMCHIPGEGHNLQVHSIVLIRGGGAKDVPGVAHRVIRGVYDTNGVIGRTKSRSKYGTKKAKGSSNNAKNVK